MQGPGYKRQARLAEAPCHRGKIKAERGGLFSLLGFWLLLNQCQVFNLRSDSSVQTVKAMGGRYRGLRTAHLQSLYSLPTTPGPPYNLRASPQSNKTACIHRCHPPNCMPPATRRPTDYIHGSFYKQLEFDVRKIDMPYTHVYLRVQTPCQQGHLSISAHVLSKECFAALVP